MAKTQDFQHDEDFDSDRETIRSHQKDALRSLEDSINKFKNCEQPIQVKNITDRKLYCDFPVKPDHSIKLLPDTKKEPN